MIPGQREVNLGIYKLIDGIWHKRCNGPGHDEPTYLPATEKYFYVRKKKYWGGPNFVARCRLCANWEKLASPGSDSGFIEVLKVHHIYQEAVNRIGLNELSLRTGVGRQHIYKVLNRKIRFVRKRTFKPIMLELISIRRKGENSISNHARWRVNRRANGFDARYCSGCSVLIVQGEYTEDCKQCQDRRSKDNMRLDPNRRATYLKAEKARNDRRKASRTNNK